MNTEEFLLEDYKLKVQYLTAHFSRMWTRFNFFLTINSALFAFSVQRDTIDYVWLFASAGILLSALWYVFGAADNYLVEVYRKQVQYPYKLLVPKVLREPQSDEEALKYYSHVGEIKQNLPIDPTIFQWRYTLPWRGKKYPISATELAVIMPIAFLLLWIFRLLFDWWA
jgi:uncharacterized MnhB-related membrane protein